MKAFPFSVMTYEPNHPDSPRYTTTWHEGMDLRDYFAAKAMQSVVSILKNSEIGIDNGVITRDTYRAAACAYAIADAMMKERKQ